MRIGSRAQLRRWDADAPQQAHNPRPSLPPVDPAMQGDSLADLGADSLHRVPRRHRILENQGNLGAAKSRKLFRRQSDELTPIEGDGAADDPRPMRQQAED